jgi:hypothetical protein
MMYPADGGSRTSEASVHMYETTQHCTLAQDSYQRNGCSEQSIIALPLMKADLLAVVIYREKRRDLILRNTRL